MKQILEAMSIIFVLMISPFVILAAYDLVVYMPKIGEINQLIKTADSEDKNPPKIIQSLIEVSHQRYSSPSTPVARELVVKYMANRDGIVRHWVPQYFAWEILTRLHFSNNEIISLFCTLIYNGQGHGLNALSLRIFNKPLSALTTNEAAEIMAYIRAPSYYGHDRKALERMRDVLLERLNEKHN